MRSYVNSTVILSVSPIFSSVVISIVDSKTGFDMCLLKTADVVGSVEIGR